MKIVIIEDEELTADDLINAINNIEPEARIIARLNSVHHATAWFKKNDPPDLIFSDIQLGDGLCFDIFKNVQISAPVIFCTAYNEYALNAFKTNGIDYVLKPFDEDAISSAFKKFKQLEKQFSRDARKFENLLELFENRSERQNGSILVYYRDKILPIRIGDIALFYIENETTHLATFDQRKFTINKRLDELEEIAGSHFYRANRQYLINRKAVKDATQFFARSLSIALTIPFPETIKVNKVKVADFLQWLSDGS